MSVPLKVNSFADYQRVLEIADRFNADRPDLPISITLAGHRLDVSADPNTEPKGVWYMDVISPSPARLQFFTDEITRLEREARSLEKILKINAEPRILALPQPEQPEVKEKPKAKRGRKPAAKKPIELEIVEEHLVLEEGNPLSSALKKLFLENENVEKEE